MKKFLFVLLFAICLTPALQAKVKIYTMDSPDGRLTLQMVVDTQVSFTLMHKGIPIVGPSVISMTLEGGRILGPEARLASAKKTSDADIIDTPLYRQASINAPYNQTDFKFKDGFGIQFRLYNQGAAYRFYTNLKGDISVTDEQARFMFNKDYTCYIPYSGNAKQPFQTSFENVYTVSPISEFNRSTLAFMPLLVCLDNDVKVCITESDLESYPGMFLRGMDTKNGFGYEGVFAPIPNQKEDNPARHQEKVLGHSNILAKTTGTRTFPWRLMVVSEKDTELPVNDLVYALGTPNRIGDTSWIQPGKSAWDWWNNWGITNVDFPVGINTDTYKYIIDFASTFGLEYVILDEGWSPSKAGDVMKVIPEIDLKELVSYAKKKNVDLMLWFVGFTLDEKLEEACRHYSKMGIKGFKVDFMDRDDQEVVEMNYRIAAMCAKYHLLVDFHGMYKPTGFNRTYPNVINYEGIFGLEQSKWSAEDMVQHDVTFPFIRMMAGPVDYTQGGMRNVSKKDFKPLNNDPIVAGTRAHQVAMYVVLDSPLVMLCDNQTIYLKERETTEYIAKFPTVWDETRILDGHVGEYIVTARRKGDKWYVGGLNNWTARDITVDLSFLKKGESHIVKIYQDGINAHNHPVDYKIIEQKVNHNDKLKVHLAPGGGFAMQF